jgi:FkbM family methyltransferase
MQFSRISNTLARSKTARFLLHPMILLRRGLARRRDGLRNRFVENLQKSLAEDPVVHLTEFQGTFVLDKRSHLFARVVSEGVYEPELAAVCVARLDPNRDAIDVGANAGFYTNLMARQLRRGRRVLAIEPTPNALDKLHSNVIRNDIGAQTLVFEGIASDRECTRSLHTVLGKEEYSSIGTLAHPSIVNEQSVTRDVQSTTIDALVQRHGLDPGFIKIDVEGAEHEVLRGAEATLLTHRPVVLSELSARLLAHNGTSASEVIQYMQHLGYRVTDPLNPGGRLAVRDYGDMLCLPIERDTPT